MEKLFTEESSKTLPVQLQRLLLRGKKIEALKGRSKAD